MTAKGVVTRKPGTDEVTEAGLESFPASDPPAFNMPGRERFSSDGQSKSEADTRAATQAPTRTRAMARDDVRGGGEHAAAQKHGRLLSHRIGPIASFGLAALVALLLTLALILLI
jgi:type VI protein secretion system component VasF